MIDNGATGARAADDEAHEAHGAEAAPDRLRLFSFTTARNRADYLWVLRAFDHARGNYVVLLHAAEIAEIIRRLPGGPPPLTAAEIGPLLESLHGWGVLQRSYDGARASTLADYRNRHFVYQLSQAGYQAFRAVVEVLDARADDAALSRLVLPDLLDDLQRLAAANEQGDAAQVYRRLTRLGDALGDLADRAAQFYLMLGELARTTDATPETFLAHKDALLTHLRDFSSDLARYAPKLAAAAQAVVDSGVERMLRRAAAADERVFATADERTADWQDRWSGLARWFLSIDGRPSETDRLRDAAMSAIAAVLALLRRVTETRRRGVSRDSQLRHLAAWFAAAPSDDAAHALFEAVFGLGRPRHLGAVHPDDDLIESHRSWWEAPPVEIARTLAETGRPPSSGAPARVQRNEPGLRRMRERQLDRQQRRSRAAAALGADGVYERTLDDAETEVLLELLNVALTARVPVTGEVARSSMSGSSTAAGSGVRLTLAPHAEGTTVRTARGLLHLDGLAVTVA